MHYCLLDSIPCLVLSMSAAFLLFTTVGTTKDQRAIKFVVVDLIISLYTVVATLEGF